MTAATARGRESATTVDWRPTAAWYRLLAVVVLTVGLSIGVGRADLAVLAAPFVLLLVQGVLAGRRETTANLATSAAFELTPVQGDRGALRVGVPTVPGAQFTIVSMPTGVGEATGRMLAVPADRPALHTETAPLGWGPLLIARPDVAAAGPDGLWDTEPVEGPELTARVMPTVQQVDGLHLRPILGGWSGEHSSRRPGAGSELIDLRQYAPGDRLRSIHWRAYARHQKLYVRRTESSADAEIALCLDTRHDIGPDPRLTRSRGWLSRTMRGVAERLEQLIRWYRTLTDSRSTAKPVDESSLDLLVGAAAAVAATQLKLGDRVGVLDLAAPGRHLQMGTGTRHLQRIRQQLSDVRPSNAAFVLTPDRWRLPSAAIVVFVSALADEVAVQAALDVRARGHQVQVVDVLPADALLSSAGRRYPGPGERAARHLRLASLAVMIAERDLRLDRLRAAGIPILRWEGGRIGTDIRVSMRADRVRR